MHFALCILPAGCAAVGAILYKVSPPPTIYAKYKPSSTQPVAVVVINVDNPAEGEIDSEQLARMIGEEWKAHSIGPVVDPNKISDQHDRDPAGFRSTPVADIGKAAGAGQVLFVNLKRFDFDTDVANQMMHGQMDVNLRLIDANTGKILWPGDVSEGFPMTFELPMAAINESETAPMMAHKLETNAAASIVQNFYNRFDMSE